MMREKSSPPNFIRRRYRLSKWLGRGSIGLVYLAQDEALDRQVVIKFLEQGETDSSERSIRFLREARAVAHLSHPNIMAIYDVGQEQGWEYLVLEFISGGNLYGLLQQRGGKLPLIDGISIVHDLLGALAYAHEQGIIHRDIKPENILITKSGQVKIADFSLARADYDLRITQDGAITGTIAYLAPECLRGEGCSPSSDLYSLGVVFYELLVGRLPFEGDLPTLLKKIMDGSYEAPSKLNTEINPELEQFIQRLMEKNLELRFPSVGVALNELKEIKAKLADEQARASRQGFIASREMSVLISSLEIDRRLMGEHIQSSIIDPLKLLLAQANTFEQTLSGQPNTRMVVSVLASLARQVLQQANDLEANLRPAILEKIGLEPALEALADRYERTYNLGLTLNLARLPERPPPDVELTLFRLTQDVLEILRSQHSTQTTIKLYQDDFCLTLEISFDTNIFLPEKTLDILHQRIKPIGADLALGRTSQGQTHLVIHIASRRQMQFTPREQQILEGLVRGLSNKEIAVVFSISPRTVNYHLDNIFSKLGVRTRTEAAVIALRQGLVRQPSQNTDEDPG